MNTPEDKIVWQSFTAQEALSPFSFNGDVNAPVVRHKVAYISWQDMIRFRRKVEKRGPSECWPWLAGKDKDGYGQFSVAHDRVRLGIRAHRTSYLISIGPIPDGMCVCHRCDNPACCNPSHLFLGTNIDNVADKLSKGRQAQGNGHGSKLHPESIPRGEKCHNSKLTERNVREIHNLLRVGLSTNEIASRFNITVDTIRRIRARRIWKHLELDEPAQQQPATLESSNSQQQQPT